MSEPILNVDYWNKRIDAAFATPFPHHSIFRCPLDQWHRIERRHQEILEGLIGEKDSILDCGCGYGRLLSLRPAFWSGNYLGIDHSSTFIELAERRYPHHLFSVGDLRDLSQFYDDDRWDWAILVSIRPMVKRNCGDEVWAKMESEIRRVANKLLYLEYDENDTGSVE